MKNKKLLTSTIVLVIALAVFAISTFAAAGNLSAYQKLKENILSTFGKSSNTSALDSLSNELNASISIDGEVVFTNKTITKTDGKNFTSHSENTTNGVKSESSYENIVKDGKMYNISRVDGKVSNAYLSEFDYDDYDDVYQNINSRGDSSSATDSQKAFVSALIDTMVGDAKNYFYDKGDVIGVKLEGSQIPELVQLGINAVTESEKGDRISYSEHDSKEFEKILKLSNLRVVSFMGEMGQPFDLDSAQGNGNAEIVLSGIDASGKRIEVKVVGDSKAYDVGSTVVEQSSWDGIDFTNTDEMRYDFDEDTGFIFGENGNQIIKIGD